jgi:uncharacterized protein YbjT (DUF2867 family)
MIRRIFVTGASGFVGRAVVRELLVRGYHVHALAHRRPPAATGEAVTAIPGGLFDPGALDRGLDGCVGAIHLVGILREDLARDATFHRIHHDGTVALLAACARTRVRRIVHMSALGTRPGAQSEYHRSKFAAEEAVRNSGLDWTILRPSLIHGPGGEMMQQWARLARGQSAPWLFMPYFGPGFLGRGRPGRIQPVYVEDVARALADALENPRHVGEVYALGGPDKFTWPEFNRVVSTVVRGRPKASLALPAWKARMMAKLLPGVPFNVDMVEMGLEDNTCDLEKFLRAFGWEPQAFEPTLRQYAGQLGGEAGA